MLCQKSVEDRQLDIFSAWYSVTCSQHECGGNSWEFFNYRGDGWDCASSLARLNRGSWVAVLDVNGTISRGEVQPRGALNLNTFFLNLYSLIMGNADQTINILIRNLQTLAKKLNSSILTPHHFPPFVNQQTKPISKQFSSTKENKHKNKKIYIGCQILHFCHH